MSDPAVRTREAGYEDVPGIVELSDALFREDAGDRDPAMNLDWPLQEGHAYFANLVAADDAGCWLAESAADGEVVGYLVARLDKGDSLRPVKAATLESMYVRAERRGSNVGAKLVERFLLWAGERGAQQASVTAYAANTGAIRFYEREGFSVKSVSLERSIE